VWHSREEKREDVKEAVKNGVDKLKEYLESR
jgi:hypothetical protein